MLLQKQGKQVEARRLVDQAIARQQTALKVHPDHPTYRRFLRNHYVTLSMTLIELGDHAEAANTAELVIRFASEAWKDHFCSATVLAHCVLLMEKDPKLSGEQRRELMQSYTDRSRKLLREALDRGKDHPQAQNDVARFLATCQPAQLRDPTRAVELARKVTQAAPKAGDAWTTLGLAHYRAGDWKAAIEAMEKAMPLRQAGDSTDYFFLAMAHWQLGKKGEARRWYDKAVQWMDKMQPQNEELLAFRTEAADLLGVKERQLQPQNPPAPNK